MSKYVAIYLDNVGRVCEVDFTCTEMYNIGKLGRQAVASAAQQFRQKWPKAVIHRGNFVLRYVVDPLTHEVVYPVHK